MSFERVAELSQEELNMATVYAEGWQSWSPVRMLRAKDSSERAPDERQQTTGWRPGKPVPPETVQAEGLLAVAAAAGGARAWYAPDPAREVATLRLVDGRVLADGPVTELTAPDLDAVLAAVAARLAPPSIRDVPSGWSSWSCYFDRVKEDDLIGNAETALRLGLPLEVVQLDHGYEAAIGDWLDVKPTFGSLARAAASLRELGLIPGIWTAPFLVDPLSRLASEHPGWLVRGGDAGVHWGRPFRILDISNPAAAEYLADVYRTLAGWGFAYHKLDFLYSGAIPGVEAYRTGMRLIRDALGPGATVLASGAPLLPSIGLCEAMRVGPDVVPEAPGAQPDVETLARITRMRAWMNGRLWVNDPDHLVARPAIRQREAWAAYLIAYRGVVFASDRFADLDARGLELTRVFLGSGFRASG